ncbi:unnamed protein product [Adineta ricciae]|uniref:Uncharacterized protein n=1 Tax=Adineta ricciae TaxID=249248 RepID=A0A814APM7_ADIRI|nr:unnamed protein product [Adineta ricciae]CAF1005539.1 unnamed protein product [Adineta ricciae]
MKVIELFSSLFLAFIILHPQCQQITADSTTETAIDTSTAAKTAESTAKIVTSDATTAKLPATTAPVVTTEPTAPMPVTTLPLVITTEPGTGPTVMTTSTTTVTRTTRTTTARPTTTTTTTTTTTVLYTTAPPPSNPTWDVVGGLAGGLVGLGLIGTIASVYMCYTNSQRNLARSSGRKTGDDYVPLQAVSSF